MTGLVCFAPGCDRKPTSPGGWFCTACWRCVPVTTKLAIQGHEDEIRRSARAHPTLRDFLLHSLRATYMLAALQAWRGRDDAPTDRETLAEAVRIEQAIGGLAA